MHFYIFICIGAGDEITDPCTNCRGNGVTSSQSDITVKIPMGVVSGTSLRVKNAGNAGMKGGSRYCYIYNAYINIFVIMHAYLYNLCP